MRRACIIFTVALGLAVCISVLFCSTESVEIQAATGNFTVPEPTPTPTPTPTPSPTPTPEPTLKLTVDMTGNVTEWLRNEEGILLEDVISSSRDNNILLKIPKDTIVLDSEAKALTHIVITLVDPSIMVPPLTPPSSFFFVNIYQLSPDGANLSKPADIVISYNPPESFLSPNPITLRMYSFNSASYEWNEIPILLNFDANTVSFSISFSINHFSIYALAAALLPTPTPTPQTSPIPTPTHTPMPHHNSYENNGLLLFILTLPAASLLFFIYVLTKWRRKSTDEDADS